MAKQIDFNLLEIDRVKTKAAVEGALEKYTIYLLIEPDEHLPNVTQTFSIVPPSLLFHLLIQMNFIHLPKMQQLKI